MGRNKYKNQEEDLKIKQEGASNMSFDAYFQGLMLSDFKIMAHHKAPMRVYAQSKGLESLATKEEFDEVFKTY